MPFQTLKSTSNSASSHLYFLPAPRLPLVMFGSDSEPPFFLVRMNEKPPKARKTWNEGNHWHQLHSMIAAICATAQSLQVRVSISLTDSSWLSKERGSIVYWSTRLEAKHLLRYLSSSLTSSLYGCGQIFMLISQSLQFAVIKKLLWEHYL